jgi:hypothetical protein
MLHTAISVMMHCVSHRYIEVGGGSFTQCLYVLFDKLFMVGYIQ